MPESSCCLRFDVRDVLLGAFFRFPVPTTFFACAATRRSCFLRETRGKQSATWKIVLAL